MKVKIEFDCGNAAFEENPDEIGYVLERAREKTEAAKAEIVNMDVPEVSRPLMDTNGNSIGFVRVRR